MKKILTSLGALAIASVAMSQATFERELNLSNYDYLNSTMLTPKSPLTTKVLFVGGVDRVQTTATYGQAAGSTLAKEWHDFIGLTPDKAKPNEFWISINHEMIQKNDSIGDGGGMSVFKAMEDAMGNVTVLDQTLSDGRSGKFFNVDFVNTVGETGMNCGGITSSVDGRIWTAEEWFRDNNKSIAFNGTTAAVRDTANFTIKSDIEGDFNNKVVKKYENFNYMVEIDPMQAKAIRKQYNWGRQGFEGGVIMPDNKTVFLGVDNTPAFFLKFEANTAGDFTSGKLFVFKEDATNPWLEVDNKVLTNMLNLDSVSIKLGATMYNRLEWVALDAESGMVYLTETGSDSPGAAWAPALAKGCKFGAHHTARATAMATTPDNKAYTDYYGRVLKFNPSTNQMSVLIEGGAGNPVFDNKASFAVSKYPAKHLSNPDGLGTMKIKNKSYLIIQEDLNGQTFNRVPFGIANSTCEMFLLDLSIANPTVSDLIRITAVPHGAEITGAIVTPSNKTILVNSQHPNISTSVNTFPYNHSLTVAITGFEGIVSAIETIAEKKSRLTVYPNPVAHELRLDKVTDFALYDMTGKLLKSVSNNDKMNVSEFGTGSYIVVTKDKESNTIIIE